MVFLLWGGNFSPLFWKNGDGLLWVSFLGHLKRAVLRPSSLEISPVRDIQSLGITTSLRGGSRDPYPAPDTCCGGRIPQTDVRFYREHLFPWKPFCSPPLLAGNRTFDRKGCTSPATHKSPCWSSSASAHGHHCSEFRRRKEVQDSPSRWRVSTTRKLPLQLSAGGARTEPCPSNSPGRLFPSHF